MRPLSTALLVLLLAAPALAQNLAESLDITVIEVPVTVADRAGNAMRGLTAGNFEILVDGKKVPIEYFETLDLTKITAGSNQPLPAAAYRNFLLLFDVANSAPGTLQRAQDAASTFIKTQIDERDLAAVAAFTSDQGARMMTSFTRDKELLLAAVASMGADTKQFMTSDPLLLSVERHVVLTQDPRGGAGKDLKEELEADLRREMEEYNTRSDRGNDMELRSRLRTQLENFGSVARALDRLRGQKQVILLSEGFDVSLLTGNEDLSFKATEKQNAAVASGELWNVDSDQRFGGAAEGGDARNMVDLFRRSDVRLHAIDIKGLRVQSDTRDGLKKSSNEGLFLLTRPTGGTVFRNDNDLSAQFDQLLRQQEVIYLLGFKARNPIPGAFHPIRVKLVGTKGEVTHRSGYYDATTHMTNVEAMMKLSQLLMTGADVREVPLSVVATAVPGADGKARVPVVVDAAGPGLLQGVEDPAVSANMFVYAFDEQGRAVDFMQQRVDVDLNRAGQALRASGLRYVGALRLAPGKYTVKALVRVGETGRVGLTTTSLDVPAFGETAILRPMAVREMGQWVTVVSPARGADAKDVLTFGNRPLIPDGQPELTMASVEEIALMLLGVETENLAVTPQLVAADGSTRAVALQLAGRSEPDGLGMVKLLFRFTPENVAPGNYDLRLDIVPPGQAKTMVSLPVVVR